MNPETNEPRVFFRLVAIVVTLYTLVLWYYSFQQSAVTPDMGYTIPMAEQISEGKWLYRDLGVQHTTLQMFIFSGFANLIRTMFAGSSPQFEHYLALTYFVSALILILTACLLCSARLNGERIFLAVALGSLGLFLAEGWTINMEPYVLLFGLPAQLLFLYRRETPYFIFSGLLCGLAFITKQYGIFVLGSIVLTHLTTSGIPLQRKIFDLFILILSFSIVALAYLGLLSSFAPGGLSEVLGGFGGTWYEKYPLSFPLFVQMAIFVTPFIVFVPFGIPIARYKQNDALRLCAFAFLLSMMQGFVRQYYHYYIHCLPYALALSATLPTGRIRPWLLRLIVVLGIFGLGVSSTIQFLSSGSWDGARANQRSLARSIMKKVPPGSRTFVIGPPFFLYLSNLKPPDDLIPGYNFIHNYSPDQLRMMVKKSEFVLVWTGNNDYYQSITQLHYKEGFRIMDEIEAAGFKQYSQIVHSQSGIAIVRILRRELDVDKNPAQG